MLGRLSIIILNTDDSIRLVNTPDVMKCKYINKFSLFSYLKGKK